MQFYKSWGIYYTTIHIHDQKRLTNSPPPLHYYIPAFLVIVELRVGAKVALAAALGHGALDVAREPLPRVVQVQDVLAAHAKRREAARHARLVLFLGPVRARHADDLEAHDAPGEVPPAVGTADARADARREQRVARLHAGGGRWRGRRCLRGAAAAAAVMVMVVMVVGEGGFRVAVDAAQGNLPRGRLDQRVGAVALGALGGLDLELGALEEEAVALEQRAVGVAPGAAAKVVNVLGVAERQHERGRLVVVKLFDVLGKDVDEVVRDAGEDNGLDVALVDGEGDLVREPARQLVVVKVADGDVGAVREGQRALVGDEGPVARGDERRDGAQVRIRLGGDRVVKVELLPRELLVAAVDELQRERDEEELRVRRARLFEDANRVPDVAVEERPARRHGVDRRRVVGRRVALEAPRVVGFRVAPAADFEAELPRVRPLGEDGVEAREASLLAVRADEALPLQGVGEGRSASTDSCCWVSPWFVSFGAGSVGCK